MRYYFLEEGNHHDSIGTTMSSWTEEEEDMATLPACIRVHSPQYTKQQTNTKNNSNKYDGIYLHHNFGDSSLSWLPILSSLVSTKWYSLRRHPWHSLVCGNTRRKHQRYIRKCDCKQAEIPNITYRVVFVGQALIVGCSNSKWAEKGN